MYYQIGSVQDDTLPTWWFHDFNHHLNLGALFLNDFVYSVLSIPQTLFLDLDFTPSLIITILCDMISLSVVNL